ncbi:type III-A CRISPR-associated protein Cas10/Csm1 [Diplocloster agilis]|uniref:CRISPR system single-strand-specific deoxyribonuclease Cas10/Csm1 (subtype III-A) n=1 Tax=Diplocloster agilis TaxID=2850323 RepID=A0A949JX96_9FIRM|nr:type III-A CRISPR-associated protein Cas10/Csm1 [Diplocloster agilis]MBU9735432.1 type III-A CRISPR-associated protein Cas10/Csm1 [Diplocloster agilis]
MKDTTYKVILCGLFHDVGRIVCKAYPEVYGQSYETAVVQWLMENKVMEDIEVLQSLPGSGLVVKGNEQAGKGSGLPAYIISIANYILTEMKRQELTGQITNRNDLRRLESVFNYLNGRSDTIFYEPKYSDPLFYPVEKGQFKAWSKEDFEDCLRQFAGDVQEHGIGPDKLNSLIESEKKWFSAVGSAGYDGLDDDISLFDRNNMLAALGSCISEFLDWNKRTGEADEIVLDKEAFTERKAFLLYTSDISGVQQFIYMIKSDNVLKTLRSRSFFLEIFMEHYIDELLSVLGLSRANLIYSGGAHCYLLLPNTEAVSDSLKLWNSTVNKWFRDNFDTHLYMASAWVPCSAKEMMNIPAEEKTYQRIFRSLSNQISKCKMQRYTPDELRELNGNNEAGGGRECKVCGSTDKLLQEEDICAWCHGFAEFSKRILQPDGVLVIYESKISGQAGLSVPVIDGGNAGEAFLYVFRPMELQQGLKADGIRRIYVKNNSPIPESGANRIYMGDYYYSDLLSVMAEKAKGIGKIGVLRLDVDNLGATFISGFQMDGEVIPSRKEKYVTLTRTAVLSRKLSLFFKNYMNQILQGDESNPSLKVDVVYSGGDDVFLIGAWSDIVDASIRIQESFQRYTAGKLSLSGGIGIFDLKYPVHRSAERTAELEVMAKALPGKNAVVLFDDSHVYPWSEFRNGVINEKLSVLKRFFHSDYQERGNAFLYRILEFLRGTDEKINIARYAYLLATMKPDEADEEKSQIYTEFSRFMYQWILEEMDREELITAIYVFLYLNRIKDKEETV